MKLYPLSIEEKLGFDVLRARLDVLTLSRLGQDRLAGMRPSGTLHWLEAELARVAELQDALRFDDRVPFDHLFDLRDVLRQAAPADAFLPPDELLAIRLVLETLDGLKSYFTSRAHKYPKLAERVERIMPNRALAKHIAGIVDEDGNLRDDASPELRRIRRQLAQRQHQLRETLLRALRDAIGQGFATEEQPTLRNGRMVIPIRAEAKRKVQGFVQDSSASGQTVYIEPTACLDLNNEVRELEGEERREIERILRAATAEVRLSLDDLHTNLRALAEFDLLQAKAKLANQLDATVPQLNTDGRLAVYNGRSPVLHLHFQRQAEQENVAPRPVVPLTMRLGGDFRTLVITGPNAGGKSVAMKTIGLFALMLSYGLPLPVDPHSQFALFKRLIVDIGDEQSMEEDLSTFSSHVANLQYMLRHAGADTLILIDEAGTGTDPAEGSALAQAVLEHLTASGCSTIATTHHGSLKAFAHEADGVENGSMQFDQQTLSPTYRFQPGIPGSSYAFEIAARKGLPNTILERARGLVGSQKAALEDLLTTFEARTRALEKQLDVAQKTQVQAEATRTQYQERSDKLHAERDHIRQQALVEAERIVREANARVERTIREIKEAAAEKEATRSARAALETFKEEVTQRRSKAERQQQARSRRTAARATRSTPAPEPSRTKTPKKQSPPPSAIAGPLQVGDQVVLDDGNTTAEVLELHDREAVIALGTMRMRVKHNRLRKVGGPRKQQVVIRQVQASGGTDLAALRARQSIDLRGFRVDEALLEVTQLLDAALAANLEKVEILHGKGTGALRQAIHEILAGRADVAHFEDAPWNQGGAGVTLVTMR